MSVVCISVCLPVFDLSRILWEWQYDLIIREITHCQYWGGDFRGFSEMVSIFKEVASMSQSPNDVARPYLIALIDHTSSSNKGTRFHKIEILNIDSTKFSENVPCE